MTYIKHNLEIKQIELNGVPVLYYEVELPCAIVGTVVDIETTGLKPGDSYITGLGLVKWNKLSCFVIVGGAKEIVDAMDNPDIDIIKKQEIISKYNTFREWCKTKVAKSPAPRAAYNKYFEQTFLGKDLFAIEIQPIAYQKKDAAYFNKYRNETMEAAIQIDHIGEMSDGLAMITADAHFIMKHLIQDMYAELALYVTKANVPRQRKEGFLPYELRDI